MQCLSDEQLSDEQEERISQSDGLSIEKIVNVTKIETRRLTLRKPQCDDIDAISDLANNTAVANMLSRMPHPYGKQDAADFVNKVNKLASGNCVYAITLTMTGEIIGCCGIEKKDGREQKEIGYWLGQQYWGNGYATEAAHALVDMAFEDEEIEDLVGHCRIGNYASRRILQKSGFQFLSTGIGYCLAQNSQMPIEIYRLERAIWASLRNWPTTFEQETE
ncbi:GNAT family N-acetyltransferase [Lentilitoribacter sp. EG35]|uniref:GNAT family N-acetyltransferase n=1 Tax=Lentilitoribacter sp. EG35 TaxID=3234192 RepID=UPI00345FD79B